MCDFNNSKERLEDKENLKIAVVNLHKLNALNISDLEYVVDVAFALGVNVGLNTNKNHKIVRGQYVEQTKAN